MRYLAITIPVLLSISALPLTAQVEAKPAEDPKIKLASMVTEAAGNPAKLFTAAQFAKTNELDDRATELFEKILASHPKHKAANEALGHKLEGKTWMAEVKGIWVETSQKTEALDGIFYHDSARVNAWEKKKFFAGEVRHRYTRMFIKAADVEKANAGQFPLADGQWGDMAAADKFHSDTSNPWILRTNTCYLVSTLPYNTLSQQVWKIVDSVYPKLKIICGGADLHPNRIPVVWIIDKTATYIEFGDQYGDGESSHGAFHPTSDQFTMMIAGSRRPVAACNWGATGWGPFYTRHAAGLAIAESYFGTAGGSVPNWFKRGLAGFSSRLYSNEMAAHFGKFHVKSGAPKDLKKWFSSFQISGDNPNTGKGTNDYHIYQAGLLVKFCMQGGDSESTDALMAVTKALSEGKGVGASIRKLQKLLNTKSDEVISYLETITG